MYKRSINHPTDIEMLLQLLASIKIKRLGVTFASVFGLIWLFLEPAGLFMPQWLSWGWQGYIGLTLFSLLCAIALNLPRKSVCRLLSSPDSAIEIHVGNLFDEPRHLVIGANDVFDTEPGDVIKLSSVQGQFLTRLWNLSRLRENGNLVKRRAKSGDTRSAPHLCWGHQTDGIF